MAQLSNDCFAAGDAAVTIEEALAHFSARVPAAAGTEEIALADAAGRILARAVMARNDLPPFANSAVDGYAARHSDIAPDGGTRLRISARLQAGAEPGAPLKAGEAARIFTGAALPEGADIVFMQEDAALDGGDVIVPAGLKPGANARSAGEELKRGAVAVPPGRRLRAADIALAAAAGAARVSVRRRLSAALFSTGDELVEPGAAPGRAQIYDTNRLMLKLLMEKAGLAVTDLGILRDEPVALAKALEAAAASHDLIITSGGVSAGEADFVRAAVQRAGTLHDWRFAVKPGRPLALGTIRGAAFAGLPGNPAAVYVTFTQIVRGLIAALAGETWTRPEPRHVQAGFGYLKKKGRREFVRCTLEPGESGIMVARKFEREGAGLLSSLTETQGLVELAENVTEVFDGQTVPFISYAEIE